MDNLYISVGLGLVLFVFLLWVLRPRKKRLTQHSFAKAMDAISSTSDLDPAHAVLKCHSAFIQALKSMYAGKKDMTAAKLVKSVEKRLPNTTKIWAFHRMRNRIAHESQGMVAPVKAKEARREFIRALEALK